MAVSANIASHYNIVPLRITDDALWVATCDPFNHGLRSELELVLDNSHRVELVLATSEAITKAIRKCYGIGAATVEQMVSGEQMDDSAGQKQDLVEESKALSRCGVEEFVVDGVIVLNYLGIGQEANRSLQIRKMRRTNHGKDIYPFKMTDKGIVLETGGMGDVLK